MKIKKIIIFLILGTFIIASCTTKTPVGGITDITIYKNPNCGCCVGHAKYLESKGYNVKVVPTGDLQSIKQKYGIPGNMESCHTAVIGDYFVEGHMPLEAIEKLLTEKPDIDGIALPNMPAGSAGMPGVKQGTWTIYAIKDRGVSEFTKV